MIIDENILMAVNSELKFNGIQWKLGSCIPTCSHRRIPIGWDGFKLAATDREVHCSDHELDVVKSIFILSHDFR